MSALGKLCSVCQAENEDAASVCTNCGAWLEENPTRIVAIPENIGRQTSAPVQNLESYIDVALIPEDGIGIYIAGAFKPYYVHIYRELILGRQADATLESVLDLSDVEAVSLGVSKRHAMIRRTVSGYEVIDLSSRNGTWLNASRLVPERSYPFASGSQLRLGHLRMLVAYRPVLKDRKKG